MRKHYDEQLVTLKSMLAGMCSTDADAMRLMCEALASGDAEAAARVKACERAADENEREIEKLCMMLIVRQQPVAHDLALVTSAMKMVTDLERITDQAVDIAEIASGAKVQSCVVPDRLCEMAGYATDMVEKCANALGGFDAAKAREICKADDVLDGLFDAVKAELAKLIASGDEAGECALNLLMIAKYLERIGDNAVNVAEWIIFSDGLEK